LITSIVATIRNASQNRLLFSSDFSPVASIIGIWMMGKLSRSFSVHGWRRMMFIDSSAAISAIRKTYQNASGFSHASRMLGRYSEELPTASPLRASGSVTIAQLGTCLRISVSQRFCGLAAYFG